MLTDNYYVHCEQCPRKCGVNRLEKQTGFCRETDELRIAFAGLHFGEEPLITVNGGSGTIFFTGCTLRCKFCQNYQISQDGFGKVVTKDDFVQICRSLQNNGAENINLVTPSHHIPKIADFISAAKNEGVTVPFCWNSSAYESVETLELLKGLVTIWLPDLKTLSSELSAGIFDAQDYPEKATKAIKWMIDNNPLEIIDSANGKEKMISGVIIRHLYLPGRFAETADVLDFLKQNADGKACISLMNQYTPIPAKKGKIVEFEDRLVNSTEDSDIQDLIEAYDFDYLFYQELSDDTSWLPDFKRNQPFSNKLAKTVWHC